MAPFEGLAVEWLENPYSVLNKTQSKIAENLFISQDEQYTMNECKLSRKEFNSTISKAINRLKYPDVQANFDWWLNYRNKSHRDQFLNAPLNNGLKKILPIALIQNLTYMGDSITEILEYYHEENFKQKLGKCQFEEFKKYLKKFDCSNLLKTGYSPLK
jgi:hypothetical protein